MSSFALSPRQSSFAAIIFATRACARGALSSWSNARSIALARNRVGDDVELGTLDEATFSRLYGAVPVASVHKSNCRGASLNPRLTG